MRTPAPTHVAYSDESNYNKGRFRNLALVTLALANRDDTDRQLRVILAESGVKELKWAELKQARERFAAEKVVCAVVGLATAELLRVDVLTWDTQDDRHSVQGRDDIANLTRMYEHVAQNVLARRWPSEACWVLHPDENGQIMWNRVRRNINSRPAHLRSLSAFEQQTLLPPVPDWVNVEVCEITQCVSHEQPLCQVADIFAGLAVYSRTSYDKIEAWERLNSRQGCLDLGDAPSPPRLSNSDKERIPVVLLLDRLCKAKKLGVSLRKTRGFWTPDPKEHPINFWLYEAQHDADRAPVKG